MKNRMLPFLLMLVVASSIAIFAACNQEDDELGTGTLALNFKLTYDGDPISMYEDRYEYADGTSIFFDRFNLFLSNITLLENTPDQQRVLKDVAFLDYAQTQDETTAQEGITIELTDIPVGNHEGLNIGLGLTPELNATTPADYSTNHPMANNYWEQWNSYISMVVEGKADTTGNGMHDLVLTYHIGKDPSYADYPLKKNFEIKSDEMTTMYLEFDLKKLFTKDGEPLDIRKYPIDHSSNEYVYDFIRLNMVEAMSVSAE